MLCFFYQTRGEKQKQTQLRDASASALCCGRSAVWIVAARRSQRQQQLRPCGRPGNPGRRRRRLSLLARLSTRPVGADTGHTQQFGVWAQGNYSSQGKRTPAVSKLAWARGRSGRSLARYRTRSLGKKGTHVTYAARHQRGSATCPRRHCGLSADTTHAGFCFRKRTEKRRYGLWRVLLVYTPSISVLDDVLEGARFASKEDVRADFCCLGRECPWPGHARRPSARVDSHPTRASSLASSLLATLHLSLASRADLTTDSIEVVPESLPPGAFVCGRCGLLHEDRCCEEDELALDSRKKKWRWTVDRWTG